MAFGIILQKNLSAHLQYSLPEQIMVSRKEHVAERRRFIVEHTQGGDSLQVIDVMLKFGASKRAIYNDLAFLRDVGLPVRTRGGVISNDQTDSVTILREISFPPKYKEAGVAILSYFSTVLTQRYPATDASVTITQKDDLVTMKIETNRGDVETIEKALSDYGRVVVGDLEPSRMLPDPVQQMQLRNKLEITSLELRLKEQSFLLQTQEQQRRIESLERETGELRSLIGMQLTTVQSLGGALARLSETESLAPAVARALDVVVSLAGVDHDNRVEEQVREALELIRREDKNLYERMKRSISAVGHSVTANLSTPWVVALINSLP